MTATATHQGIGSFSGNFFSAINDGGGATMNLFHPRDFALGQPQFHG
jgi:hypothetical protein